MYSCRCGTRGANISNSSKRDYDNNIYGSYRIIIIVVVICKGVYRTFNVFVARVRRQREYRRRRRSRLWFIGPSILFSIFFVPPSARISSVRSSDFEPNEKRVNIIETKCVRVLPLLLLLLFLISPSVYNNINNVGESVTIQRHVKAEQVDCYPSEERINRISTTAAVEFD